jgi:hypothetical protein
MVKTQNDREDYFLSFFKMEITIVFSRRLLMGLSEVMTLSTPRCCTNAECHALGLVAYAQCVQKEGMRCHSCCP